MSKSKTLELLFQLNIQKPYFSITTVSRRTVSELDDSPGWERFIAIDIAWLTIQAGWFDSDMLPKGEVR